MRFKKIVAATDFSETALGAVKTAFKLAVESQATLYLVNVVGFPLAGNPITGVRDTFTLEELFRTRTESVA